MTAICTRWTLRAIAIAIIAVAAAAKAGELPPLEPDFEHWLYFSGSAGDFGRKPAIAGTDLFARAVSADVTKQGYRCDTVSRYDDLVYLGTGHATLYCNDHSYIYELDPVRTRTGQLTGGVSILQIK